jgi:hypothetical protein
MVSPTFLDVPSDLFAEIVKHVGLKDLYSLLAVRVYHFSPSSICWFRSQNKTCSAIRKYSESRFLWISVLTETRSQRPLPCPSSHDLSNTDLSELKRIARQCRTLDENWNEEAPRVVGAVRVMSCPPNGQIVALVPGANLIILHAKWERARSLICLDTSSAKYLDIIPVERYVAEVSHPYEEQGTFMIAMATGHRHGWVVLYRSR